MKAVLISIQPKWCELIASGKKTVEVRKTKPKIEVPFKVYIYCTKGRGDCLWRWDGGVWYDTQFPNERPNRLDGKVIGEFVCDDIDTVHIFNDILYCMKNSQANKLGQMCLTIEEVKAYLGDKNGYNWHISDLKIYDKPRELMEFCRNGECAKCGWLEDGKCYKRIEQSGYNKHRVRRPPQSWCYVESEDTE